MLSRLEINDFALIENASLEFREGFTVMTGETGAGKSILIDAIGAVCGERTNRDIVRTGKEVASVTAVFDDPDKISVNLLLSESGIILEDDSLIVTREIMSSGKTVARINGRIVPISLLRKIMSQYIDIHGQNENQSLFIQDTQLLLLDRYGQRSIESIKDDYNSILNDYREVCTELKAFITEPGQKEKVVDLLKYQIREIRDADIKPEEDIKLLEQRKILANAEKIRTVLEFVIQVLNGEDDLTAIPAVKEASLRISSHLSGFEEFNSLSESLNDIACSLEDVNAEVLMALDRIDADPVKLSTLDKRIDLIEDLKHKYGGSIESVLLYFDKSVKQLSEIISSEDKVKELTDKRNHLSKELSSLSAELFHTRSSVADKLENAISNELASLGMKGTVFKILLNHDDSQDFVNNGMDTVEFMISPNVGEDLKPLSRIASGGESSRIMLAIKAILAQIDSVPVLIFDEIDTGISGKTGDLLADKLVHISGNHQVLCVTHMAQIAAKAGNHIKIEKEVIGERTFTKIKYINMDDRAEEIARLLSGDNSNAKAVELAEEMLRVGQ